MFLALIGATLAVLGLARVQDRQISACQDDTVKGNEAEKTPGKNVEPTR